MGEGMIFGRSVPRRLLVVDGDDGIRQAVQQIFQARGYDVQLARAGLEAVELVRNPGCDVVLLDLLVPGWNGWDTFSVIRSIEPDLRVITMSPPGTTFTNESCEKMGSFRHLEKPFSFQQISDAVELAMQVTEKKPDPIESLTNMTRGAMDASRGGILLADDDDPFRTILGQRLRIEGFGVDEVTTGQQAVAAWHRNSYDIGLFDIHMPCGTGTAAATEIHAFDPMAVIEFMTGEASRREIETSSHHAIGACLTKPLSFEKISQKVTFLISIGQRSREQRVSREKYDSLTALSKSFHKTRLSGRDRLIL